MRLFLLHGFAASSFTWRNQLGALGEHHDVVALDRRWAPAPEATRETLGQLDHYGAREPVVLVGHSAGAEIALRVSEQAPDRVLGLVLLAPVVGGGPPAPVRLMARLPGSAAVAPALLRLSLRGMGRALRRTVSDASCMSDDVVAGYREPLLAPGAAEALWSMTLRSRDDGFASRIPGITAPSLVILGREDRWASAPPLPNVTVQRLDRCGHLPHEEHPATVNEAILGFCQKLPITQ